MELIKNVILRIIATFVVTGLGVIGAGTIAGVSIGKAIFMAGIGGVANVLEGLARAFLTDGKLSEEEVNEVFSKVEQDNPAQQ
jgi:hypothetical protein